VGAGNVWFTLIGFMGMYTVLAILWLFLVYREIEEGPGPEEEDPRKVARVSIPVN
jgi:cytochrome d ubiquinol oxidase subunit I